MAHCFTCSSSSHATARISGALAEREYAVLRFDFTGLGQSGGDFADTTFTTNVEDLLAAAQFPEVESVVEVAAGPPANGEVVVGGWTGSSGRSTSTRPRPRKRDSLLRIADGCPIHRTLTGQVSIVTTVTED